MPVKKVTPLPRVTEPAVWEFSAHPHHAKRSGTHTDIRLGNPASGIAHSLVLPKQTALPEPGESALVIPTFDHTIPYMDYFGPISTKYGLGVVEKGRRTQTEVYHADPSDEPGTKLRFNLYEGDFPEEFAVRKDQKGRWFIHNKTQTREKRPDIPAEKPKYKEIDPGKIDVTDDRQSIMPKLDGAHAIIDLKAGRSPRAFSYRVAKRAKTGFIEHTHKMPGMLTKKVPKELDGTVLRAEIVGVKGSDAWERQVKLPAKDLKPLHEVTDRQKLRALTKSMKERGWVGDPVVVDDNLRGLSGSHRIAAAKQLGLEVPALVVGPSSALKGVTDDDSVLKRLAQHNLPTAVRLMERQHPGTPPKVTLGRAIPAEQIGGLLNSKVWASRHAQAEMGVRLKAFPFDVVTHKGKPMSDAPFSEKLKVLREVEKSLADLDLPEIAATPEEKINLLNRVKSKQHPLTEEGLVLVEKDRAATPIKAKFAPDFDVYVRDVHPAVRADTGAAHDRAGSVSYSWEPAGPVVGQVGGFKHDEARDMLANPDKYVGRVAKVKAMKVFTDAEGNPQALFQPRFREWHLDKGDIEKTSAERRHIFYHGTAAEYGPSIEEKGLIPRRARPEHMAFWSGDKERKKLRRTPLQRQSVHLTSDPYYAAMFGIRDRSGKLRPDRVPLVYRVELTDEDIENVVPRGVEISYALNDNLPYGGKAYVHKGSIPPSKITKMPKEDWPGWLHVAKIAARRLGYDPGTLSLRKFEKTSADLYHGSPKKLKVLKPKNLHGDPDLGSNVFATPSRVFALPYAGRKWGDRDIEQSAWRSKKHGERMVLREMRPGAFEDVFGGKKGYLYEVPDATFESPGHRRTRFEVVSNKPVRPEGVEVVPDVLAALEDSPFVTLIRYDKGDPKLRVAVKRNVARAMEMTPEKRKGYLKWRLEGAPGEVKKMFREELSKSASVRGFLDELRKIAAGA